MNDAPALRHADIGVAVGAGRQGFDNVRKFVLYNFAHAVPEVVPFLVIDLGTETLPALALGREPAEPGARDRPPRPRRAGVIDRGFTSAVVCLPVLHGIFGTRGLSLAQLAFLVPLPFVVWGCDETFRWVRRGTHVPADRDC